MGRLTHLLVLVLAMLPACSSREPIKSEPIIKTAQAIKTAQDWARVKGAYFVDYEFSRVGVTQPGPGAIASIEFMSTPITDDDIRELAPLKPGLPIIQNQAI